jgi:hypothetical protein
MSNHLIDIGGEEFQGERLSLSWIYGIYVGRVTFYEEMASLAFLQSRPNS